jgi:hypothetical protein
MRFSPPEFQAVFVERHRSLAEDEILPACDRLSMIRSIERRCLPADCLDTDWSLRLASNQRNYSIRCRMVGQVSILNHYVSSRPQIGE